MKVHYIDKYSEGDMQAQDLALGKLVTYTGPAEADLIYCGSIAKMSEALQLKAIYKKPLVTFCWDYYLWAHEGKAPYWNWPMYRSFLQVCDLIFVPSNTQQRRLKELLSLDSVVVHSGVTTFDIETSDGGYILDPVRYYPEENGNWARDAAQKLGIPFVHPEHRSTYEEYKKLVANCTFITSCYREASTGGLSIIEGLYLGKATLTSNSPYQGANDYLGDYAFTFQYDNFDELVDKMRTMWIERVKINTASARMYISQNFTYDIMAQKICEHFKNLLNEQNNI